MSCLLDAVLENDLEKVRMASAVDIQKWRSSSSYKTSLLYHANSGDMVRLLVSKGMDPNEICPGGFSVLFHACLHVRAEAVRALVELGACIPQKRSDGSLVTAHLHSILIQKVLFELGSDLPERVVSVMPKRAFSAQIFWNVFFV